MVRAAITDGGTPANSDALIDHHLIQAYDNLAWYRYLSAYKGPGDLLFHAPDLTPLLQELDWDRSPVEEALGNIKRSVNDADSARGDMTKLKFDVTNAWDSQALNTLVQGALGGLLLDYQHFHDNLSNMHKDFGNVIGGVDDATSQVLKATEDCKSTYGSWAHGIISKENHPVIQQDLTWAAKSVQGAVAAAKKAIGDLTDDIKPYLAAQHMAYSLPPAHKQP